MLIGIVSAQESEEKELTAVINSPSSVGDVAFPHQFHSDDLEIECQQCHHETNASPLKMPHENYFDDFWIDCRICHRGEGSDVSTTLAPVLFAIMILRLVSPTRPSVQKL